MQANVFVRAICLKHLTYFFHIEITPIQINLYIFICIHVGACLLNTIPFSYCVGHLRATNTINFHIISFNK